MPRYADIDRGTGHCVFQVQLKVIAQIRAPCRRIGAAPTSTAATENIAKHIAKDVAEIASATAAKTSATKAALAVNPGMAKLIVSGTFFAVG